MALSNLDRVNKGLELLRTGLLPYVEREMKAEHQRFWETEAMDCFPNGHHSRDLTPEEWDVQALLTIMFKQWYKVFGKVLGHQEKAWVSELMEFRKRSAHQNNTNAFNTDDAFRTLDNVERLLMAVAAPEAEEANEQKSELLRIRYEENTRKKARKLETKLIDTQGGTGLKPWRQIVTPHPDVASGKFQQAEFAADLWRVYQDGEAAGEYGRPVDFFNRTYLTQGIRRLLSNTLQRLSGQGGDPVINLQTNFGGGKTHSLLALYHLCSGADFSSVRDLETFFQENGDPRPPSSVNKAVLVGNRISPGIEHKKPDGTVVHTLWGEIAWQLGGKEGYAMVQAADEKAANPGDQLVGLMKQYSPCVILIDEWVSYARQLHESDDLNCGSYGTHISFAQALCEAAKAVPNALVVISLPTSEIEKGGERGKQAADELGNIVGRIESPWTAATTEESFEIVTRRLFLPISSKEEYVDRDATARSFVDFYRSNKTDFPSETHEDDYRKRIENFYPIHPELFDYLAERWASIAQFQKTRGILRLMAKIIHFLWTNHDLSSLITPANIPLHDADIQSELIRYLEESWRAVIDKDVDGPHALPGQIDKDYPNIGRYSAARRVARTLFFGSAPTFDPKKQTGLDEQRIKLGSIYPGENIPTFADALRHLTDRGTFVYHQNKNYWYSTKNNVNRTAEERANHIKEDEIEEQVYQALAQQLTSQKDKISRIHLMPKTTNDVPDDTDMKLVVLGMKRPHTPKDNNNSAAYQQANEILTTKGNAQRLYRNTLLFLAPDKVRLVELKQAAKNYLAWSSIVKDHKQEVLYLDGYQLNQAEAKLKTGLETIKSRILETFLWILTPFQEVGSSDIQWDESRMNGSNQDKYLSRVVKKLTSQSLLYNDFAASELRMNLDRVPLWRDNDVPIQQLKEDFAKYLYLPKLSTPDLLTKAIETGISLITWEEDTFAFAESYDAENKRYKGIRAGIVAPISADSHGLLVKHGVAKVQLEREKKDKDAVPTPGGSSPSYPSGPPNPDDKVKEPDTKKRRYFGHIETDAVRFFRTTDDIDKEILKHLNKISGTNVKITIHIEAENAEGFDQSTERTLRENAKTLGFGDVEFE